MKKFNVACFGLGYDQKRLIKKLSKYYNVIGFDNDEQAPAIRFVKKFYNVPFIEKKKIKNILIKEKVKQIYSFATEAPQILIGYLNSNLKLKGLKYNQIQIISNKIKFRNFLKKNKINQPAYFSYKNIKNKNLYKKKIIIKPIIGSASENISILYKIKKISKNYKNFIFEEYLKTKYVFALDGFYLKNKFVPLSLSKKIKSKDNIFVDKKIMFNVQNERLKRRASIITEKICSKVKVSFIPVHHEFIVKNKKIFPIDFHLRGPGSGFYTYLMNKLIYSKLFETLINLENLSDIPKKKFFCCVYFINNMSEKKNIQSKIKRNTQLKYRFINFNNKKKYKQNSARDRIGAFYFEFNEYINFKNFSKKIENL